MHSPAMNQQQYDRKISEIQLCGKNMGPHDYIPVKWEITKDSKAVTWMMCRTCFRKINVETIGRYFPDIVT